ncbi:MAG TPA: Sir2 family NAD-dependent protein deacetylase, partial [Thermodesulfobacteriota bacterium]|jgi:NAD-dependent deacetylase|nr:Sir2 family NAD-dependent protein deacetylase [Thermodesulfobacteriota bacterium]
MEGNLAQVAEWIINSKRTIVFSGAGLSTESGIPDFRSPGGVWDKYDPEDFYFQNFIASEASREKYWQMATEMWEPIKKAQPNPAHLAIAELERLDKLDCVITQNIDGLHFKAGNSEEKILQLHGTAIFVSCLSCQKRYDRDEIQERIKKGQKAPRCDGCGGLLKPATISFGQSMPEKETQEAYHRSSICDLFIVIGSSLVVQPAASMPLVAKKNGAKLVIINRDPTPYDDMADLVIHGQAGSTMASIMEYVKQKLGIR